MSGHESPEELELIARLENNVNYDTSPIETLMDLGLMYMEPCHREDEAIRLFEIALERDPRSSQTKFWLAYCLIHYRMDPAALKRAKELVEEIIAADPECAGGGYYLLSEIMQDLGNLNVENNIQVLELSVRHKPHWVHNHVSLASAYWNVRRTAEAIAEMRAAIDNLQLPEPGWGITKKMWESLITGRIAPRKSLELDLNRMLQESGKR
jgi:tetratricopeptide (TPR) repeat protein